VLQHSSTPLAVSAERIEFFGFVLPRGRTDGSAELLSLRPLAFPEAYARAAGPVKEVGPLATG
jgi:hypothetical protein